MYTEPPMTDRQLLQELYDDESNKRDVDRAVGIGSLGVNSYGSGAYARSSNSKNIDAIKDQPALFSGMWTVQDTAFLDQYVMLNDGSEADEVYQFLLDGLKEISNGFKNYREFRDEKKIIGNYFDETRQGCYRLELFNLENSKSKTDTKLGINCTRLEGDALSVSKLWNKVKDELIANSFLEGDIDMNETDDESFFSDDDDEDFSDMDDFKYLNFSRDSGFVGRLINDIADVNVGTHSLLLLAFNLESKQNLKFLHNNSVQRNFAQEIFNNITQRLQHTDAAYVDLPVARCAGSIINSMIREKDSKGESVITIAPEQMKTLLNTIINWGSESDDASSVTPTASEEATFLLTECLKSLSDAVTRPFDATELLEEISQTTEFDRVKDNVDPFLVESN